MKKGKSRSSIFCLILLSVLAAGPICVAQGRFEVLGGKALIDAVPRDFYLTGNAIPVEKRNAALLKTSSGARVLVALLVTTGWASQLPHRFSGMLISEGKISVCGNELGVGSYGFGLRRPPVNSNGAAEFDLYDQSGRKIGRCRVPKDLHLKEPRPLQVVVDSAESARVYLGRYRVELRP